MKNHLATLLQKDGVGRKRLLLEIYNSWNIYKERKTEYLDGLENDGIYIVAFDEKEYPSSLLQIYDFPILLFCKGNREILKKKCITVVGTRNMTEYGSKIVQDLLGKDGDICFVSGLANGVDAKVHITCIKKEIPTIAIVAGGLYEGFPRSNSKLFEEICEKGLVISEFPPGRRIIKGMFPMRNRILAGISKGVVIIESGIKGGSMITANLALEYGRDVFAVPGDIFSESSEGCNFLISQGAKVIFNKEEFSLLMEDCIHR